MTSLRHGSPPSSPPRAPPSPSRLSRALRSSTRVDAHVRVRANIANDESDFGASLQLGQDVFNHSLSFARLAARTLTTAYTLLDREPYAEIARMHAPRRTHSP